MAPVDPAPSRASGQGSFEPRDVPEAAELAPLLGEERHLAEPGTAVQRDRGRGSEARPRQGTDGGPRRATLRTSPRRGRRRCRVPCTTGPRRRSCRPRSRTRASEGADRWRRSRARAARHAQRRPDGCHPSVPRAIAAVDRGSSARCRRSRATFARSGCRCRSAGARRRARRRARPPVRAPSPASSFR